MINKKILLTQNKFSLVNKASNFINNKKPKIAYVYKYFEQPNRISGMSSFIKELAGNIKDKFNLEIISYKKKGITYPKEDRVKRIGSPFLVKSAIYSNKEAKTIVFATAVDNCLSAMFYFIFFRLFSLKNNVILHQVVPLRKHVYLAKLNSLFFKKIICTSEYIKKQFNSKKAVYIPPAVDTKKIKSVKSLPKKKIRIGFFGHIIPNKGADVLLDVFMKLNLKNVELLIAGTGENYSETTLIKDRMIDKAKGMKNIRIMGFIKDVKSYIKSCDFIVLPYRDPYTILGLSQTGIEAMALGKPLIVSEAPSVKPLVRHNFNGHIFKDKQELGEYIEELVNNKNKTRKFGKNSLKMAKNFDAEKISNKFIKEIL